MYQYAVQNITYSLCPVHNLNSFHIIEGRITSSEQLKIITEYTSVVYKNTFNTICIILPAVKYGCTTWSQMPEEENRQDLSEKSAEVRQLDMQKRT